MTAHAQRRGSAVFRVVVTVAALMAVAAGCGTQTSTTTGSTTGKTNGTKVALLLPETKTARYESQDRPLFEQKMKALCPNCTVIYSNADQDAAKQQQQVEAALVNGANVLVLDPVDSKSAAVMVDRAKAQNVPVVSYDRLIQAADVAYYISFDNIRVGQLQGESLVKRMQQIGKPNGTIVMINGSPTDSNAAQFKQGALSVIDKSGLKIGKSYDTPDWSPDVAQNEMQQAITALGAPNVNGTYAANDGTAGGAVAAMLSAGVSPWPPVTGQDAELAGIQRIVADQQYMDVYKAIKPEAEQAAQLAYALLKGQKPPSSITFTTQNNGTKNVQSVLLTPVEVTKSNIKDTVVKDGFWTVQQICTPQYAQACAAAGLT